MEELVKKEILQIESGVFAVLDESETGGWENLEDETLLKYLQDGKAYSVATHADGNFEVKAWMLDKRTDVWKLMEEGYDFIFKTEWAIVRAKTGKLMVSDPSAYTNKDESLKPIEVSVPAGNYWIMTGLVKTEKDFYGIMVFLIPTDPLDLPESYVKTANNSVKKIGEFD